MPDTSPQSDPITTLAQQVARLADVLDGACVIPEGLAPQQAAAYCGISPAKFHAMNTSGALGPSPVEMGERCPRFLRSELLAWLRSGCPSRAQWRYQREAALRRTA